MHSNAYSKLAEKTTDDLIITLQPTSPLRNSSHIDEAVEIMSNNKSADSLVSCVPLPHNFNPESLMYLDNNGELMPCSDLHGLTGRRQDKSTFLARNGAAIYITRSKNINSYIIGGRLIPYIMKKHLSIDIDEIADLLVAESILKNLKSFPA